MDNRWRCDGVIGDIAWEIGHNVMWGNWRQHMGNMWHSDGAIDYIMQEMMSI
jgi:hypothetical protein